MAAFHARDLHRACELFREAAQGGARDIALAAKNHQAMCEQRIAQQQPAPKTAEDHYTYGVALINQRRLADGISHLRQALELDAAGHTHYALSVAYALERRFEQSAHHLVEAIRLDPSNRVTARNDPDFAEFLHEPALRAALQADRNA